MKLEEVIEKLSRLDRNANKKLLEGYLEDFIPNQLLKSDNLQKAFEISDTEMHAFYKEAYLAYENGNYKHSIAAFEALVILNPFEKKYWMGFAASNHLLKKYEKALEAYAIAAILDTKDPFPHFYAYQCYKALGDKIEAGKALNACELKATHFDHLKQEIERIKTL